MAYLYTVFAGCALVYVATAAVLPDFTNDVVHYSVEDQEQLLFDYLMNPRQQMKKPTLGKFVYKNCGDASKDLANVSSLTLGPDPVVFPGNISISFKIGINKTLDAPLQGQITILKKFGSSWIKIPCIGSIGSCTYSDVCDLLKNAVCPQPFVTNNIPCRCPFTQGKYTLPSSTFTVDVPVFPAGDYHAIANLKYQNAPVACVELFVTFA